MNKDEIDNTLSEIRKYFNKVFYTINGESGLILFNKKSVNKKRIDDLMCCIEGTFPKEYRDKIKMYGIRNMKSALCYSELLGIIKKPSKIFSNKYVIQLKKAKAASESFMSLLKSDLNNLQQKP